MLIYEKAHSRGKITLNKLVAQYLKYIKHSICQNALRVYPESQVPFNFYIEFN